MLEGVLELPGEEPIVPNMKEATLSQVASVGQGPLWPGPVNWPFVTFIRRSVARVEPNPSGRQGGHEKTPSQGR